QGEVEAREHAARQAALEADAAEVARARREAAETLAREVGDAERRRLAREGLGGAGWGAPRVEWPGGGGDGEGGLLATGSAFRLLALIPDPRWRLAAGVALVAAPALLYVAWPIAGLLAGGLVLALFLPGGRGT
ncbi:MAG TPA: hypothetical protein VFP50_08695, partial [Anaeromyxobacteraceae bacterium]|nr:hypothetical protein [Anaeromyxobacteraceae bacterium]